VMAQLEMDLVDVRLRIPWEGRSPRDLTRVRISLSLKRERQGREVDPRQFDLFDRRVGGIGRRGPLYEGAPLLVPLADRRSLVNICFR